MAFFENLGKKIADMGQGVAQQTKTMTETAKLNGSVSEKRKQINELFATIGQGYYAAHKDDPAAEQAELIRDVNSLYAEIARAEEEIKTLRGYTKCPTCGADVPSGASFCSKCGTPVQAQQPAAEPEPEPAEQLFCPNCHMPVDPDNSFCTACGARVR